MHTEATCPNVSIDFLKKQHFNIIYLLPNPSYENDKSGPEGSGGANLSQSPKVNVIPRLEFELAYYDVLGLLTMPTKKEDR